jgi:hypothetical protein
MNQLNQIELEHLLQSPNKLKQMDDLLNKYQFPESFLVKTINYYNPLVCLRTQLNLSPYFCFRYLYNTNNDSYDTWTDYSEIYKYLTERNYSTKVIQNAYIKATNDNIIYK